MVEKLHENYICSLISFVTKEARQGKDYTLKNLLQFLLLYDSVTDQVWKENKDDPRIIKTLPILVKIAEKLIRTSKRYATDAINVNLPSTI